MTKNIAITQEQLDKISDDFQSTFTILKPNLIANMFSADEIPRVSEIIKKHLGDVFLDFCKTGQLGQDEPYDIYYIRVGEYDRH